MRYFLPILILLFGLYCPAHAEESPRHIMTVTGTGQVTAKPDTVNLTVGVETQADTVEAARSANADKMQATIRAIHALKLSHLTLQTSGFYVYPMMDKKQNKHYQATNNLAVKLEESNSDQLATDTGRILDVALSAGANTSGGPNFYMSQNNQSQQEALKLAIQQAKDTAQVTAQAAGVKLTGISSIDTFQQAVAYHPRPMMRANAAMIDAAPTPIESGDQEVTSTVTMRFEFEN